MKQKKVAIIGSTGSIGKQALEVIEHHKDRLCVEVLTANSQADLLIEQALRFDPNAVVIADNNQYKKVKEALASTDIKVFAGQEALEEIVQMETIDIVLTAIVGFAGLKPTLKAIEAKKPIALSNKETLVVAGELVTKLSIENNVPIIPVDSEHSAIFQCLAGEFYNPIEKIILTASGGPFLGKTKEELIHITPKEALNHPNWVMGNKVTIDSATLMNKGLEVIEAKWLFDLPIEKIETVVHPQSIIHSLVEFEDGSVKAQLGLADMRLPIQYALTYPERLKTNFPKFNIYNNPNLSFLKPDSQTFPCLSLAYQAIQKGGNLPTIMNAANEIAVEAFLKERIGFLEIPEIIANAMSKYNFIANANVNDFFETDKEVREELSSKYLQ
ncbi:MAG: 1-deoxy-D-xylulose-5-phosphate reductoisomerase [Bacteroidales bacterium]|jgi:1-deoxy-D-xylulose-5-phosphate reductoisomerase|nr:1-deoxy-D-xylulose-5-phosphate reductoisomerase [Bacteroidales bacterium]MDD4703713.1 1-deoxy-D-xylulose-5-phosphate reductoisomerase [Bacteroidales bacterium]MDX9799536.1 1-deoxy-D-xylulose-5-phosphate reductoisomerase [Bacteroidales bacterium]